MRGINKTRFWVLILSKWFQLPTHGWVIEQLLFWEAEIAVRGFLAAQGSVLPTPVLFKVMCISNAEGVNGPKRTNDLETCGRSVLDQEKVTHRKNQNLSMQRLGYSPGYSRPPAECQGLVPIEDPYPILNSTSFYFPWDTFIHSGDMSFNIRWAITLTVICSFFSTSLLLSAHLPTSSSQPQSSTNNARAHVSKLGKFCFPQETLFWSEVSSSL